MIANLYDTIKAKNKHLLKSFINEFPMMIEAYRSFQNVDTSEHAPCKIYIQNDLWC